MKIVVFPPQIRVVWVLFCFYLRGRERECEQRGGAKEEGGRVPSRPQAKPGVRCRAGAHDREVRIGAKPRVGHLRD